MLHSAAIENRTNPECHRSRAKNKKGPLWHEQGGSQSGWGNRNGKKYSISIETSSRQKTCSPTNCTSIPGLRAFLVSVLVALMGIQIHLDLCCIFLFLCFSLCIHFFLHFSLRAQRLLRRWYWGQEQGSWLLAHLWMEAALNFLPRQQVSSLYQNIKAEKAV